MHARRTARDAYAFEEAFFTSRGDIVFGGTTSARLFAERVNERDARSGEGVVRPADVAAMALLHEIFHTVIAIHREKNPASFATMMNQVGAQLGEDADGTLRAFLAAFPPPAIYRGDDAPERLLAREGPAARESFTDEVILLWFTNQNPAYGVVRPIVSDEDLPPTYRAFVAAARRYFDADQSHRIVRGLSLFDVLFAPIRHAPNSIFAQLQFIEDHWGEELGLAELAIWRRLLWARDFLYEEGKWFFRGGPGPGEPTLDVIGFAPVGFEPKQFSEDLDWMPRVVLIAKSVYVWLGQLSKKYARAVERLDQVPDEELDWLAARGFNGLWLIGLFERSAASRKVKQMRGDQDALASAYSLHSYQIAESLGGHLAFANLRDRAAARGVRLAADMVPNHVGIDAEWVIQHPDWFLQAKHPPFPSYRFGGTDLSSDERVGIFLEEGYWNHTDAAVVFRRHDRWTGDDRFIYHGNDGTSMPWNDTAQLDYTRAEVRRAVIETILHVARMFPIIRFDAAMTLAKRHYQRLWFPLPGHGGAIPSRSDYAMTQEEFERVFPVEFWREVVDTVAARAPDTLLLAEAFWMMEGYFVRTLGMHRVYNSAFMNMLKREENEKYRQTIKNVLDFDPEVLKRFVNFMNNPDEETAVAQFGTDDKYFGVCLMMSTMPGLPMFGHGQIEGFHEKYGMEYARAKWDEQVNEGLVARHEREIFPLLQRRWLYSGVENFALYDFHREDGGVDEDVFAYTNRVGESASLVLYHNKWKDTRGRVHVSVPSRRDDGSTRTMNLVDALGLDRARGAWVVFRDAPHALEYVRSVDDLGGGGLFWELHAFKYHVFVDFRVVHATGDRPYDRLATELEGRGVPSIEFAARDLVLRPVHAPLRDALGSGHLAYLASDWPTGSRTLPAAIREALGERLGHVADGLAYMRGGPVTRRLDVVEIAATQLERLVLARASTAKDDPQASAGVSDLPLDRNHLLTFVHVSAVLDLLAPEPVTPAALPRDSESTKATVASAPVADPEPAKAATEVAAPAAAKTLDVRERPTTRAVPAAAPPSDDATDGGRALRRQLIEAWALDATITSAISTWSRDDAWAKSQAVILGAILAGADRRSVGSAGPRCSPAGLLAAFAEPRGQALLGVHVANEVRWFVKERFEELVQFLAGIDVVQGRALDEASAAAQTLIRLGASVGYRTDDLELALRGEPQR